MVSGTRTDDGSQRASRFPSSLTISRRALDRGVSASRGTPRADPCSEGAGQTGLLEDRVDQRIRNPETSTQSRTRGDRLTQVAAEETMQHPTPLVGLCRGLRLRLGLQRRDGHRPRRSVPAAVGWACIEFTANSCSACSSDWTCNCSCWICSARLFKSSTHDLAFASPASPAVWSFSANAWIDRPTSWASCSSCWYSRSTVSTSHWTSSRSGSPSSDSKAAGPEEILNVPWRAHRRREARTRGQRQRPRLDQGPHPATAVGDVGMSNADDGAEEAALDAAAARVSGARGDEDEVGGESGEDAEHDVQTRDLLAGLICRGTSD